MAGISRYNKSGCLDMTAFSAINNADREMARAKAAKPKAIKFPSKPCPFVYIASPYRGDTKTNVRNAIRYCNFAKQQGKFPVAPHIWLPQFLDDNNEGERKLALNVGLYHLAQCSEIWVFGNKVTEGMQGEILAARRRGLTVRYFRESTAGIQETRRPPEC